MSKESEDVLSLSAALVAFAIAGWLIWMLLNAIGAWWHSATYVSPAEKAQQAAEDKRDAEEWAKDPRNPKVAGQKCLDMGGIPDYSAWDGDVKACNKPGGGNVDVKQSVEVRP